MTGYTLPRTDTGEVDYSDILMDFVDDTGNIKHPGYILHILKAIDANARAEEREYLMSGANLQIALLGIEIQKIDDRARAEERERCALIAERSSVSHGGVKVGTGIATAIRSGDSE